MKYRSIKFVLLCTVAAVFASGNADSAFQGDVNGDCELDLQDAILGLQVITGVAPTILEEVIDIDVDGDGRIGLVEAVYAIQAVGGLIDWPTLPIITVSSAGQIWMDRNLGACRVAVSSTDSEAFGDLYQWGRLADGHQSRDSSTTSALSDSNNPPHGDFIMAPDSPFDWREPQNNDLWQESGINNPCPSGFRLPTTEELDIERNSWDPEDPAGVESPLKFVMAGSRSLDGTISVPEGLGYYWSSTVSGTQSSRMFLYSTEFGDGSAIIGDSRALGFSVRCIQD